jgi:protein-S-isoprenylcysteine O-methyltransferase Ste14
VRLRNLPVPEPHLAGLGVGTILTLFRPWPLFADPLAGRVAGGLLVLAGVGLGAWATIAAGDVDLARPEEVVVRGPYRLSRNPMYVAWTIAYIGMALVINTGWVLVLLPIILAWTHVVVLREEKGLAGRLAEPYACYRRTVRRYV